MTLDMKRLCAAARSGRSSGMHSFPPMPIIERVEIVPTADAARAAQSGTSVLTDRYGEWLVMRFESSGRSPNAVCRLRLAIPVGGLSQAALVDLNGICGVEP